MSTPKNCTINIYLTATSTTVGTPPVTEVTIQARVATVPLSVPHRHRRRRSSHFHSQSEWFFSTPVVPFIPRQVLDEVVTYTSAIPPADDASTLAARIENARQLEVKIGTNLTSEVKNEVAVQFQTTSSTNISTPFVGTRLGALVLPVTGDVLNAIVNLEFTFVKPRVKGWTESFTGVCGSSFHKEESSTAEVRPEDIGIIKYTGQVALLPGVETLVASEQVSRVFQ